MENLNLFVVVNDVITASLEEFDPLIQKRLLSCATWGKSSMLINALKDSKKSVMVKMNDNFEKTCQNLRIFNNIKDCLNYRITYKEFEHFGTKNFIKLLINRPRIKEMINLTSSNMPHVTTMTLQRSLRLLTITLKDHGESLYKRKSKNTST